MNHAPLRPPEPIITPEQAEKIADLIAGFPPPETVGDEPTPAAFADGFREALRVACMLVVACGGGDDASSSGCAPVASPPFSGPAK